MNSLISLTRHWSALEPLKVTFESPTSAPVRADTAFDDAPATVPLYIGLISTIKTRLAIEAAIYLLLFIAVVSPWPELRSVAFLAAVLSPYWLLLVSSCYSELREAVTAIERLDVPESFSKQTHPESTSLPAPLPPPK